MRLLVVRHGKAVEEAGDLGDPGRWLLPDGRKRTRKVARWIADEPRSIPRRVYSSPWIRAVQTAEILVAPLRPRPDVEITSSLRGDADPRDFARLLDGLSSGTFAAVGHEPHLSGLVALLLGRPFPELPKSGLVELSRSRGEAGWSFAHLLTPKPLRRVEDLKDLG